MAKLFFTLGILLTLFSGCVQSPYYQKSFQMPDNKWAHSFAPSFEVYIADTNVYYNLHFIIRHINSYAYSNIWINVLVKQPGDSVFTKTRVEIPLAEPQGKWLGNGMGEIYEQRRMIILDHNAVPITDDLIAVSESSLTNLFHKKGNYTIQLQQNMRDNVLSDILHVGLRIEKSTNRKTNTVK